MFLTKSISISPSSPTLANSIKLDVIPLRTFVMSSVSGSPSNLIGTKLR